MLADADKDHGHVGRVDEADERADHVADGVALGDDEAVEGAVGAKGRVEVARLGDGVGAYQGLLSNKAETSVSMGNKADKCQYGGVRKEDSE
jgi:hypothetical protein